MVINDVIFNAELGDIVTELQNQLSINQIPLLQKTKDTPDNLMVACPYHKDGQEKKPSMGIHKQSGVCHCFTCQTTVTLQELISHCFGYNDTIGGFGWNWLLKNFLTVGIEERKDIAIECSRGKDYNRNKVQYVSEEELDSYRYIHPYMYKRKLTDEIIELFDIGYDKGTQCITFPIRDISGNTLFIARRSVKTKYFNYPTGAEKPLYGLYEIWWTTQRLGKPYPSEIIVCESMLDALHFWVVGKPALALNGLGSELQFAQLNAMPCREFILCTDSDEAGMKARKNIRSRVKGKLITEYILPNGVKDANDCTDEELLGLTKVFSSGGYR